MAGFNDYLRMAIGWWSNVKAVGPGAISGNIRVHPKITGSLYTLPLISGNIRVSPRTTGDIGVRNA